MSANKKDYEEVELNATARSISDDRIRGCSTRVELLALCAVTMFIWGLLLLPIIFYQIPIVS